MKLTWLHQAWLGSILLPLPVVIFWRSEDGRRLALGLFFIGCAILAAYAFRNDSRRQAVLNADEARREWRKLTVALAAALVSAFVVFSALLLALADSTDFIAVILACLILIPSFCLVPFFTLLTRRPLAGVVLALFSVLCMKLLGCVVVVLVYGWHADAHGYTDMPWTHPNLLVWLFLSFSGILSLVLYFCGQKRFCRMYGYVV